MDRDFLEVFQTKLRAYGIKTKVLALEAGRNASYLSEVFTGKKSPTLEMFKDLLDAAERLCPGFADDYYLSLAGRNNYLSLPPSTESLPADGLADVDLDSFVKSLSSSELSALLILTGQRLGELLPARQKAAA